MSQKEVHAQMSPVLTAAQKNYQVNLERLEYMRDNAISETQREYAEKQITKLRRRSDRYTWGQFLSEAE